MGLENLKRWHWALIGLLLGAMFGATRAYWRDPDPGGDRSFGRNQFADAVGRGMEVRNLVLHPADDGKEWLTGEYYRLTSGNIGGRFRPQRKGTTQPAQERPGEWVKFPMLAGEERSGKFEYQRVFINGDEKKDIEKLIDEDIHNGGKKNLLQANAAYMDARSFMAYLQKQHSSAALTYKFAWWEIPKYTVSMYALGGLVLIGGVFSTVVSLISGAGFGIQKKVEDDYDLSRFKPAPKPAEKTKAEVDQAALAELNAKMEENVADMLIGKSITQQEEEEEEAHAIKQLQTQTMDATETPQEREAREAKEYQGEFYPVAKPTVHKDEKH